MAKTIKTKQDTPFQSEYVFDDKAWQSKNNPGEQEKNWSVPYVRPDIQGSQGQYGFGETSIPQQSGGSADKMNAWGKSMPGGQKISDERQRIMDSIKRRSLETVPDYIYNTNMPERPPMAERQVEGRSASGAGLSGSVSPESQVQDALRRLMMRRG